MTTALQSEPLEDIPLGERYAQLAEQAIEALGSEKAVTRWLGYSGHGTILYRLQHPKMLRREHVVALEALLERVNRKV